MKKIWYKSQVSTNNMKNIEISPLINRVQGPYEEIFVLTFKVRTNISSMDQDLG